MRVDSTQIAAAEVRALAVAEDAEHELAAAPPRVRRLELREDAAAARATEVLLLEDDLVVAAARAALRAVELHRAERAAMDRVARRPLAHDVEAVRRHGRRHEPAQRALLRDAVRRLAEIEDR